VYTITLSPVGETLPCRPDETVLAAILGSGASIAFGCRGGGCGTCKMRAITGQVDHGRCSIAVLPEEERTAGWFLSCQARARSDLAIELTAANRYRVLAWARRLAGPTSDRRGSP
jgi:CDP-4-dehydro-6-deoxyglucose reductase